MKFFKFGIATAVAVTLMSGLFSAPSYADGMMMAKDGWARSRTASAKVAGAFVTLHNMSKEDDRLIGATSKIAKRTEIHTTKMTDGVMKMIQVKEGITVKAGETVQMKPGSYHIMFMGLTEVLAEGKEIPVTLKFEKAGDVDILVSVKKAGSMGHGGHGGMKKMDHGSMKKTN
ncbi:copper chaperone PCu(A)C [Sneathiella sp.]|jgi:copper(I)-binding protein|uniref:copper chaperone PCu(A)C n=1 Tax=Sneathiella sp. TaxID=1964365 RepID=UPI0039E2BDBB